MRLIKLAIISFAVLFLVVTGVTLLIPAHIQLSKVVVVEGGRDSVFSLIKNKEQWPAWHPAFTSMETDEQKHWFARMQTRLIRENDSLLSMQWQQPGKKVINNSWIYRSDPASKTATLQWIIDIHLPWYPWEKLGSLFYEQTYGNMMEQGLMNIKKVVETASRSTEAKAR